MISGENFANHAIIINLHDLFEIITNIFILPLHTLYSLCVIHLGTYQLHDSSNINYNDIHENSCHLTSIFWHQCSGFDAWIGIK